MSRSPSGPSDPLSTVRVALVRGSEAAARTAIAALSGPDAARGHLLVARFLRRIRRYVPARLALEEAESVSDAGQARIDVLVEAADLAIHVRNGEEALAIAGRGLAMEPGHRRLHLQRCHALALCGRAAEAVPGLEEATRWEDWSPSEEPGFLAAAMAAIPVLPLPLLSLLDAAAARHPASGGIARLQGLAAARLRQHAAAIAAFRRAVDLLPDGGARKASAEGLARSLSAAGLPPETVPPKALAQPEIAGHPFRICAITNVYNERFNLRVWLAHYGRQVGEENCIVLDNGTDDGSTDRLGRAGRLPMPRRTIFNEAHRMRFVNDLANNMLNYYDAVLYSDCDEMVVADPAAYADLTDMARQMTGPTIHCIGLNLRQDIRREGPIDLGRPILCQRSLAQFTSPMCKPLIIRRPISWAGGFHGSDHPPTFGQAYLFHLRHADLGQALDRLATTRGIRFAREGGGARHHRGDEEAARLEFADVPAMPVDERFDLSPLLAQYLADAELMPSGRYGLPAKLQSEVLFRIPERFRTVF